MKLGYMRRESLGAGNSAAIWYTCFLLLFVRQTFCTCMLKTAEQLLEPIDSMSDTELICRRFWQWQIGMLLFVLGNIANFTARG